jgi:alcohol dehydrogenase class IV
VGIFDKIPPDPDLEAVDAATAFAREVQADCIISGGGSVIDTGKGVCVTLKKGGKANDHLNLLVLNEMQTPHIVIPTTSGTGSEVTNIAVLTSHSAGRKLFIADKFITPTIAILDPRFTMSNSICDAQALQAIRLINENLPLVIADGKDVGVKEDTLDMAAFHAICDTAAIFNAKPVNDPGDVANLYKQAY